MCEERSVLLKHWGFQASICCVVFFLSRRFDSFSLSVFVLRLLCCQDCFLSSQLTFMLLPETQPYLRTFEFWHRLKLSVKVSHPDFVEESGDWTPGWDEQGAFMLVTYRASSFFALEAFLVWSGDRCLTACFVHKCFDFIFLCTYLLT